MLGLSIYAGGIKEIDSFRRGCVQQCFDSVSAPERTSSQAEYNP